MVNKPSLISSLSETFRLFPQGVKAKLVAFILLQFLVSVFDAAGILAIGLVASLAFVMTTDSSRPATFESVLEFFSMSSIGDTTLLIVLGFVASFLFIFRTLASLVITKLIFKFLANVSQNVSKQMFAALLGAPYAWIRRQSTLELSFALNQGLQLAMIGISGQFIIIISELLFVLLILVLLLIVNPLMTIASVLLLVLFGLIVYFFSSSKISILSNLVNQKLIEGHQQIVNSVRLFRELRLKLATPQIIKDFARNREESATSFALVSWIQLIPRFTIEVTIVLGFFCLAILSSFTSDLQNAVSNLAVFLAATSRIGPSALRLQTSSLTIHALAGESHAAFKIYESLLSFKSNVIDEESAKHRVELQYNFMHSIPKISFQGVSFSYEDSENHVLANVSFDILPGEFIAFVGPSGSGKSTIFDLLLGLLQPTSGEILIHGKPPHNLVSENPGLISYLPQDAFIMPATIKNNITVGSLLGDESSLVNALKAANLLELIETLEDRENTIVGEGGNNLSGGQRQRIALARTLYLDPRVILLDEPTSALDSEAENHVMMALQQLKGTVSIAIIAHRLSTLKHVDKVIYIEEGKLLAMGTLSEVRRKVKNFDQQAKLLGI